MIAVITGDIMNSSAGDPRGWLLPLKDTLDQYGNSPKNWEIYRGDSFQLSLTTDKAIIAALHIKSTIKQSRLQDVRMAIGLGEETYRSSKITESNGSAYVNSGRCFEGLKKQTLAIRSDNQAFNDSLNTMLSLALLTANNWTQTVATTIKTALEHPYKNQQGLAVLLNRSQSNISEALKRGGFEEIMKLNDYYQKNSSML